MQEKCEGSAAKSKKAKMDNLKEEICCLMQSQNGSIGKHQGIDELLFSLIEHRAMIYAFQHTDTEENPFNKYPFFKMWHLAECYFVITVFGKLSSPGKKEKSLRHLWNKCQDGLKADKIISDIEWTQIRDLLSGASFTNVTSPVSRFRNKTIAHNETVLDLRWSDVDQEIKLLSRIWSVFSTWCAFRQAYPFSSGTEMFAGLDSYFSIDELGKLSDKYEHYIGQFEHWCSESLIEGDPATRRPFIKGPHDIAVTINFVEEPSK